MEYSHRLTTELQLVIVLLVILLILCDRILSAATQDLYIKLHVVTIRKKIIFILTEVYFILLGSEI